MSSILEVKNVVKQYGDYVALNSVSLSIPKGSIYGLLGPNGAGKTSLIRIINQITLPDSGEVLLDGEKLQPHHIQQIGYLPEERGLYKSMKVGEQCLMLAPGGVHAGARAGCGCAPALRALAGWPLAAATARLGCVLLSWRSPAFI